MSNIESCHFINANFFYVTNTLWKHAPRTVTSPNNLVLVTEGVLYIEMNGQRYTVNQGEFLFFPHGVESIGYRPSSVSTGFYCVMFNSPPEFAFPTHFSLYSLYDINPIRDLYSLLIKNAARSDYPRKALDSLMHCLFYEITYQINHTDTQGHEPMSESIKKYVAGTMFRNITVNEVAAHFGLSPDHINRVFSQSEHITLKSYINRVRIHRIEELLISTNTSLSTVAKNLGFSNSTSLSKFYKYHTGKTISEYRSKFIN